MIENKVKSKVTYDTEERKIFITRIFDAPRERVWKAWTEPERIKRWWGPKNFTSPVCKIDLRVNGRYHFCMRSREGQNFWSTGAYLEIVPFHKIVCSDSFSDEIGNVVPASNYGMVGNFPLELKVTVLFEDFDTNSTRLTLRHVGIPDCHISEMTSASWNESFDKLAEIIE